MTRSGSVLTGLLCTLATLSACQGSPPAAPAGRGPASVGLRAEGPAAVAPGGDPVRPPAAAVADGAMAPGAGTVPAVPGAAAALTAPFENPSLGEAPPARPATPTRSRPALPAPDAPAPLTATSLLVGLEADAQVATVLADPALGGFERLGDLRLRARMVINLRPPAGMSLAEAARRVTRVAGVRTVQENGVRRLAAFPFTNRDPRLDDQWAHRADRANTEAAWEVVPVADQGKVIVAVIDTGLDAGHPEFQGRVVAPRNFRADPPDADATDHDGHGTHVAGIIAAAGNDGVGVAGVAWGVKIMPVRALDSYGGTDFEILSGVVYAARYRPEPDDGSRVRVINMSLGSPIGAVSGLYVDAFAEARENGISVVLASGNESMEQVATPANTPGAIAVGATAHYAQWEKLAHFSNHGSRLDLVAPGADILSTTPRSGESGLAPDYDRLSGTSMAAPFVAGVAALVCARYDKTNASTTGAFADKVRTRLLAAVDDLGTPGWDPVFGAGRIEAGRAVQPATIDAVL